MGFKSGDTVYYRLLSETARTTAGIVSASDSEVVLRTADEPGKDVKQGSYLVISTTDGDIYTEVEAVEGQVLRLRRIWGEKREYFRVDDVFPVQCSRIAPDQVRRKAQIFAGYGTTLPEEPDIPDRAENPALWKMLTDINAKLSLILQHLQLEQEGCTKAEHKHVNLSASGIRFVMNEPVSLGDAVEMKLLLPTLPPVGVLTHGEIVRVRDLGNREFEVGVHFADMDDEVRDEIIQYALKRQRDLIRNLRQQSGNDG
ncbi:MAG: PilZ domain-containing protein [Thermodesulfovibrionales bacterium]